MMKDENFVHSKEHLETINKEENRPYATVTKHDENAKCQTARASLLVSMRQSCTV